LKKKIKENYVKLEKRGVERRGNKKEVFVLVFEVIF